jgi:hypothetical protein
MQTITENRVLTPEQIEQYERDGYFIARGLVSPEETQQLLAHFMQMHEQTVPGHYEPPHGKIAIMTFCVAILVS